MSEVAEAEHTPSRERVLRALFWQLLFRGRAAHQAGAHRARKQLGLGLTLVGYSFLGLLPAIGAFLLPPFAFAASLHVLTMMFASLTLASSVGTMLFVREEAEILLHRPVRAEELLRAKCSVLIAFSLLLAAALNGAGMIAGTFAPGSAWWFAAAHALTTVLLMIFSAATIVLVYNLCLRWFGRERFENLLTLVQVMVTVVMIAGSQIVPRLMSSAEAKGFDANTAWAPWLPPLWFAALDMVLCGASPLALVWLPAAIGVGVTALVAWLAFVRLGASYGVGLLAIHEVGAPAPERPRRRLLAAVTRWGPWRWWLRDVVERQAFLLTSAYLLRDRETKLKLYPAMAPMIVMPIVMGLGSVGRRGGQGITIVADMFTFAYAAMVPIQAMLFLRRSEHWRAAVLFRSAPVPHWTPLYHGARKAVICWLSLPGLLLVAGILAVLRGTWEPFSLVVPALAAVAVGSSVPGLVGEWLPLSQPTSEQPDSTAGCLLFGIVVGLAFAIGGVGAWLDTLGWFWPYVATLFVGAWVLQGAFAARMRSRPWSAAE